MSNHTDDEKNDGPEMGRRAFLGKFTAAVAGGVAAASASGNGNEAEAGEKEPAGIMMVPIPTIIVPDGNYESPIYTRTYKAHFGKLASTYLPAMDKAVKDPAKKKYPVADSSYTQEQVGEDGKKIDVKVRCLHPVGTSNDPNIVLPSLRGVQEENFDVEGEYKKKEGLFLKITAKKDGVGFGAVGMDVCKARFKGQINDSRGQWLSFPKEGQEFLAQPYNMLDPKSRSGVKKGDVMELYVPESLIKKTLDHYRMKPNQPVVGGP